MGAIAVPAARDVRRLFELFEMGITIVFQAGISCFGWKSIRLRLGGEIMGAIAVPAARDVRRPYEIF